MQKVLIGAIVLLLIAPAAVLAQEKVDGGPLAVKNNELQIRKDSLFELNFRFRVQSRFGISTVSGDDLSIRSVDARVRRLRLRFEGFVVDPRLKYYIQLAFSRADMELETLPTAQPIRDAIVHYQFSPNFNIGFGQTKLPGNRERMVSSGDLQFPDRSIANSAFTLDRDFGVFVNWTVPVAQQLVQLKGAMSSGEGRNALASDDGLAYTGRLEWLPFGAFSGKGDFTEGDLQFEKEPRLSIAGSYSTNVNARRTGGQLGGALISPSDINTAITDMMCKYRGWAILGEYFDRRATVPISANDEDVTFVPSGIGMNFQLSRLLRSGHEIATRYNSVRPDADVDALMRRTDEILLGTTKYLNGHRVKFQFAAGYRWIDAQLDHPDSSWSAMFQLELGI